MEDEEALEAGALVGQLADTIQNQVNDLLADGVVATGVVVGCIFLACDQLLWMEQLAVGSSSHLIYDSRQTNECKCLKDYKTSTDTWTHSNNNWSNANTQQIVRIFL